ncbi:soluble calcium-activated nucleotidase 1-like [Acanthaster planci]|uniref:Soluble calcium-activated nucleotidase 1-like n=1 Tax=Acanthaster planci TaxID=133434 RepID=A0A8B7XZ23_ACAPL|nr:soluble calcium-activated nucleotidase 1-like [Acanthaster planci]
MVLVVKSGTMYPLQVFLTGYRWCRQALSITAFTNLTWLLVGGLVWVGLKNAGRNPHRQRKLSKSSDSGVVNSVEKLQVPQDSTKKRCKKRKSTMSKSNEWKSLAVEGSSRSSGPTKLFASFTGAKGGVGALRVRQRIVAAAVVMFILILVFLLLPSSKRTSGNFSTNNSGMGKNYVVMTSAVYNKTYPITAPQRTLVGEQYRIGLISDLDTDSKSATKKNTWVGYYLKGYLNINSLHDQVSIQLDKEPSVLQSQLSRGGRGMELSELVTFNGKLYSVDDRTGVIYEIVDNTVIPWIILSDGDGRNTKGFKGEWMAVRDEMLFVGGLGKEWTTTSGELVNLNPQWVKVVSHQGAVRHFSWVKNYNAMRREAGYSYPGYMIHESGVWSDVHQRWFFLPRRASKEHYTEADDEHRATNLLISCTADFTDIRINKIGVLNKIRGFSSFKFVPGTRDTVVVALKTEEDQGKIATFYTVFNIDGKTLVPDTKFADIKYEGIEFI